MANDGILIQHVNGNSDYIHLLTRSFARHARYCRVTRLDYQVSVGVASESEGPGDWGKVDLLRQALQKPYTYVIYLDADCLIWEVRADLRQACIAPVCGVPMDNPVKHINAGAIYCRNGPEAKAFVEAWWQGRPGPAAWHEQAVLNQLVMDPVHGKHFGFLAAACNCVDYVNPSPQPLVKAWHSYAHHCGLPVVCEQMDKALSEYHEPNVLGV